MRAYSYPHLSPEIRRALDAYRLDHHPTGGFLEACIRNDLLKAVILANGQNSRPDTLKDIVWYIHNELPSPARDYAGWTECRCEADPGACLVHQWPRERVAAASDL